MTDLDFLDLWKRAGSVSELAATLGWTTRTVYNHAYYLRRCGIAIPDRRAAAFRRKLTVSRHPAPPSSLAQQFFDARKPDIK